MLFLARREPKDKIDILETPPDVSHGRYLTLWVWAGPHLNQYIYFSSLCRTVEEWVFYIWCCILISLIKNQWFLKMVENFWHIKCKLNFKKCKTIKCSSRLLKLKSHVGIKADNTYSIWYKLRLINYFK